MPFLPFVYGYPSSCPRAHCTQKRAYSALHVRSLCFCLMSSDAKSILGTVYKVSLFWIYHCATPAGMDLYIQVHAWRLLPSAVPWISEDRLLLGRSSSECYFIDWYLLQIFCFWCVFCMSSPGFFSLKNCYKQLYTADAAFVLPWPHRCPSDQSAL